MQKMNHFIALQLLFGENIDVERLKFNSCEVAYCLNQEPCLKFLFLLKKAINSNKRSTQLVFFSIQEGFSMVCKAYSPGITIQAAAISDLPP